MYGETSIKGCTKVSMLLFDVCWYEDTYVEPQYSCCGQVTFNLLITEDKLIII